MFQSEVVAYPNGVSSQLYLQEHIRVDMFPKVERSSLLHLCEKCGQRFIVLALTASSTDQNKFMGQRFQIYTRNLQS
jgi:hypothetical protein